MRPMTWSYVLFVMFALLGSAFNSARAQSARREEKLVVLQTRGVDDIVPEFTDTLRELLSRIDILLVTADVRARQSSVVAYVDIDASERGATVWVQDPRRKIPRLKREIPLESSRDVFRETLAHVVLGAVETYASAAEETLEEPAKAPEPEPQPEPTSQPETVVIPSVLYALSARGGPLWFAQDGVGAAIGGGFHVRLNRRLPLSWSVEAAGMLPVSVDSAGIVADVQITSVRANQRVAVLRTSHLILDLGIGLGIDWLVFTPISAEPPISLQEASRRLQPMAGLNASLAIALTRALTILLSTGVDLDAAPRRWVVETELGRTTILEPYHLRPYASLGLAWTLNAQDADSKDAP